MIGQVEPKFVVSEYYMGSDTWEQAEVKMNTENIDLLLNKCNRSKKEMG